MEVSRSDEARIVYRDARCTAGLIWIDCDFIPVCHLSPGDGDILLRLGGFASRQGCLLKQSAAWKAVNLQ